MYIDAIRRDKESKVPKEVISRKIYLSYPTMVFNDEPDIEFEIINEISEELGVPFTSVQIVGSAKTGFSYHKKRKFIAGESDLDVAIISPAKFIEMLDYAYILTNGYSTDVLFDNPQYADVFKAMIKYGTVDPRYLPNGELKNRWEFFFRKLSNKYIKKFQYISARVFATQCLFEMYQSRAITSFFEEGVE